MIRGAKKRPTVPLMLPTARTVTARLTLRLVMRIFSSHLGKEFNRRGDFQLFFGSANDMHVNFYGNEQDVDDIRVAVENAETFVSELDQLRDAPPRPFNIETSADRRRLGRLLGIPSREFQRRLPSGTNHPHGSVCLVLAPYRNRCSTKPSNLIYGSGPLFSLHLLCDCRLRRLAQLVFLRLQSEAVQKTEVDRHKPTPCLRQCTFHSLCPRPLQKASPCISILLLGNTD